MSNLNRRRGKDYERWLARHLGGKRIGILGREDVEFPLISAEAKERKKIPAFICHCLNQAQANSDGKIPVVFLHELSKEHDDDVVIMRLVDWRKMYRKFKEGQ